MRAVMPSGPRAWLTLPVPAASRPRAQKGEFASEAQLATLQKPDVKSVLQIVLHKAASGSLL